MWLTAAVVKTLSEAKAFTDVDKDMLQRSVVWITRQQLENGCFPVVGQVFHTTDIEVISVERLNCQPLSNIRLAK